MGHACIQVTHVYKSSQDVTSFMIPPAAQASVDVQAAAQQLANDAKKPSGEEEAAGQQADGDAAKADAVPASTEDVGSGVVREVLQLAFPISILPYFL